jgi:hypothetical protein
VAAILIIPNKGFTALNNRKGAHINGGVNEMKDLFADEVNDFLPTSFQRFWAGMSYHPSAGARKFSDHPNVKKISKIGFLKCQENY